MSYYLIPRNRNLLVEEFEKEKQETKVLLPEDFKSEDSEFVLVKIRGISPDCEKGPWDTKMLAVVEKMMLREVDLEGCGYIIEKPIKLKLVGENYVIGVLKEVEE